MADDVHWPAPIIRKLTPEDASAYWHIRLEALETEPFAFGRSAEEHRTTTVEDVAVRLRATPAHSFTMGLFAQDRLGGIATLLREENLKERHKGHLVAVYLSPHFRGRGNASRLLTALLEAAREDESLEQVLLGVRTGDCPAGRLYRRLGFVPFGTEPRSLKIGSEYIDEDHMILRLR